MNTEAARRIVAIQSALQAQISSASRNRLASEQRTLWEAMFPGQPYERIAATAH